MSEFKQVVEEGVKKAKSVTKRVLLWSLVLGVVALLGYLLICNYTYSDGSRAGILIKVSRKGYVIKTYEGQLNLGGVQMNDGQNMLGNIWEFSAGSAEIYVKLQQYEGRQVKLHYKQKLKVMPWQGKTDYLVDHVELVR